MTPPHHSAELWHYTDLQSFVSIVKTNSIWASSYTRMNDVGELQYGFDQLASAVRSRLEIEAKEQTKNRLNDLAETLSAPLPVMDLHFASASSARDSLTQWTNYGGEMPIAIRLSKTPLARRGFDNEISLQTKRPVEGVGHLINDIFSTGWRQVIYGEAEQRELIEEFIGFLIQTREQSPDRDMIDIMFLAPYLKHPAFHHEKESRFLASSLDMKGPKFRVSGRGLTTYLELTPARDDECQPGFQLIEEVMLGPGADKHDVIMVDKLLSQSGFKDVVITTSAVPYRP